MFRKNLLLFAALFMGAAAQTRTAEHILDRSVEVSGGKAAYEKLHAQSWEGDIEFAGQGLTGTLKLDVATGGRSHMLMDLGQLGTMRSGTTGEVAWQLSAMQGPRVLEGQEKEQALRMARLDAPLRWRQLYKDVRLDGEDTVAGKTCDKVSLTPVKSPAPEVQCYDRETGRLVYAETTMTSPMGEVRLRSVFLDYRQSGDLIVPFQIQQEIGPQTIVTRMKHVVWNGELDEKLFEIPKEIEELLKK
jgi:hypothetical protein